MVRKQPQTLFEVYSSFRGVPHRQAEDAAVPSRQPQQERRAAAVSPVEQPVAGRYVIRLTASQVFVGVLLALLALAVAGYAGYTIGYGKLRTLDRGRPTVGEVRGGPANPEVLSQSGPTEIAADPFVYEQPETGDADNGSSPVVDDAAGQVDPQLRGDYRVRIMSLPIEHRDTQESLRQSQSFLAEKGVATDVEQRGRNCYLYSRQTFPSESHEKAIELRDRIRQLGDEYARRVNRTNEFSSAYIVKRS
ncbi:MAG: hypothetical protein JXL80_05495 [Planctomycetes bacterium]|nr:hypothetical protein [Planctomycetota bacterium]